MAVGNQTIEVLQEMYGVDGFREQGHGSVWQGPGVGTHSSQGAQLPEGGPCHFKMPGMGHPYDTQEKPGGVAQRPNP